MGPVMDDEKTRPVGEFSMVRLTALKLQCFDTVDMGDRKDIRPVKMLVPLTYLQRFCSGKSGG